MTGERLNWDDYFLELAKTATRRSDCIRAQVGAVIVNSRNKVKGTGYNNSPAGVQGCIERGNCYRIENKIPTGTRYETCRSIHAEQNAIIQAGEDACSGSSLYLFGHDFVCVLCRRFIINAGIIRVVLKKDDNSQVKEIDPAIWINEL
ncbi:MAG: deaminase [Candidatus Theseobacter exili]|nr:deaminase [Candidatus Theseobacter exili]